MHRAWLTLKTHPYQQNLGSFPHEASWRGKKLSGTCGSAPGPYIPRLALTPMQCWSAAGHVFARGKLGVHAGFPYDPCKYSKGGLCERPRSLTAHRFARRSRIALAPTFQHPTLSHVSASSRVSTGEYLQGYRRSHGRESDNRGNGHCLPRGTGTLHTADTHCGRGETVVAEDRPPSPADSDHHVLGGFYRQEQYR